MTIEERLALCERIKAAGDVEQIERQGRRARCLIQCIGAERKIRIEARVSGQEADSLREAARAAAAEEGQRTAWDILQMYGLPDVTRMSQAELVQLEEALDKQRIAAEEGEELEEARKGLRAATRAHEAAKEQRRKEA